VLKIWHVVCTRLIILKSIRLAKIIILDAEFASFLFTTFAQNVFQSVDRISSGGRTEKYGGCCKVCFQTPRYYEHRSTEKSHENTQPDWFLNPIPTRDLAVRDEII